MNASLRGLIRNIFSKTNIKIPENTCKYFFLSWEESLGKEYSLVVVCYDIFLSK